MKKVLGILFIFTLLHISCSGQSNKKMEEQNLKYYPFNGYYFDLETLQRIEIDGILSTDFKSLSNYAFRFYAPENWMHNFYQVCNFNNYSFKIEKDQSIHISEQNSSKSVIVQNPDKDIKTGNVAGAHFLFSTSNGVIEVKRLEAENGYRVRNYNESGKCRYNLSFEHTRIEVEGMTNYHKPYLGFFGCTDKSLIFTSYNREFNQTVQINLADGKITNYNFTVNGIIRTDGEDNIPGFICIDEDKKSFKTIILNYSWANSPKSFWANTAETVLIGNVIYIAFYHGIATGSALYAFDINSGKELWNADVKQLNVDHSEYYNKVYLSAYKNKIIMEGIEAEGKYLQIFDSQTGARLYSSIQ